MLLSILTCKETLERLDDYLDRELSPREIKLVERHLKICRHCAEHFAFEAEILSGIKERVQHVHTSDEEVTSLLNRIRAALPDDEKK